LSYDDFLQKRRDRIAQVVRAAFSKLSEGSAQTNAGMGFSVDELREIGEGELVEFKSTLRTNLHTGSADTKMEHACLRTVAGFLNSPNGGTLIIGISDDGTPTGIEADQFSNEDKMHLHLDNLIRGRIGGQHSHYIHPRFDELDGIRILVVSCKPSRSPVFVKDGNHEMFFVRTGASTTQLQGMQMQEYITSRF
jgi:predicted HTH transcriptional regulator